MAKITWTDTERRDIMAVAELPYDWDRLKNSTILISGGNGFIGSHVIAVLEERNRLYGDNIAILSLSRHECADSGNVHYIKADITQEIDIDCNIDYIIHLASNTHPKQYAEEPVGTITTNIIGCDNLLKLAVKKKIKRFFLASSVEIYGNGTCDPMDETYCGYIDCNTARAGYNEAKRVSESLCQSYKQQYGVNFVTARFARVFGADRKKDSKAMAQFLDKAVHGEDIVLKSQGSQRYSYCYITDAVSGLLKVLIDGKNGEAYNVTSVDEKKTLGDYANLIASLAGKKVVFDLQHSQSGASVSENALLNCEKLRTLNWTPMYTVGNGIVKTYKILKMIGA